MRKLLYVLLITLLPILFTACNTSDNKYEFPLIKADIETVINSQKLSWNIEDSQHTKESQKTYVLKSNDEITCLIDSKRFEDEKFLSVTYFYPKKYEIEKLYNFETNEVNKLFEFSATLYGNSNEAKIVYNELFTFINNSSINKADSIQWIKRVNDDLFLFKISLGNSDFLENATISLTIMNNAAYEQYISGTATVLMNSDIDIQETTVSTILGIKSPNEVLTNKEQYFIICGQINGVTEMKTVPDSLKIASNEYLLSYKGNFFNGNLTDNTGNINVFLQPFSLTDKELKQERDHYIVPVYHEQEIYYVVLFSVLCDIKN